jgi:mRNA interferase MazF
VVVEQGAVHWLTLSAAVGSEPASRRPVVVIQHDRFNRTQLATTVVIAITSRMKYASFPGNVRLRKREAGLPKPSVVNITQIATIDRSLLGPRIGKLSSERIAQVWSGVVLVMAPDAPDYLVS